ncbi:response regulator transcription factor [Alicyclobacillus acidiphilus]|uniref:response regulator transcription factor n=1 Tax=Alicyclobacillus acidiphilus TaxID=182455 RepID=UPI0008351972|nr:response regulator transcription factor [Alicyclobacillus acidiphilus]
MRILLIEDDDTLRTAMADVLREAAYEVDEVANGDEGLYLAETDVYDAFVIDIMMPELDGIELMKRLRDQAIYAPAIFVTAKDSVESRVDGLNAGADDYLVKPFAIEELLARIRALLRRNRDIDTDMTLHYQDLVLVPETKQATVDGQPLHVTETEFRLLEYFVLNKGQILTRERISSRVWGIDTETVESAVDLYVHYLRKKLHPYGLDQHIQTVRNVGYMLKEG